MGHRILIADDDDTTRSRLADLVSSWGYEVEQAIDGKDALEKAPAFEPAVVVAGLVMPVLDGVALLKPLAAACANAVVILLIDQTMVDAAISAMREGAYDYMVKPVDSRRLGALLEKAVEHSDLRREIVLLQRRLSEDPELAEPKDAVILRLGTTLEQAERELILKTLESANNNKTRAAGILGTTPKTIHNKTRRWRLAKDR